MTIWAKHGSVAEIEANLQKAAQLAETYAHCCCLQCSQTKSKFVHIRPTQKCNNNIERSLVNRHRPVCDDVRILFIHKHHKIDTTLNEFRKILASFEQTWWTTMQRHFETSARLLNKPHFVLLLASQIRHQGNLAENLQASARPSG